MIDTQGIPSDIWDDILEQETDSAEEVVAVDLFAQGGVLKPVGMVEDEDFLGAPTPSTNKVTGVQNPPQQTAVIPTLVETGVQSSPPPITGVQEQAPVEREAIIPVVETQAHMVSENVFGDEVSNIGTTTVLPYPHIAVDITPVAEEERDLKLELLMSMTVANEAEECDSYALVLTLGDDPPLVMNRRFPATKLRFLLEQAVFVNVPKVVWLDENTKVEGTDIFALGVTLSDEIVLQSKAKDRVEEVKSMLKMPI